MTNVESGLGRTVPGGHDTSRFALAVVSLAAILPYLSTVDDYFMRDDFGVVRLLSSKPATWFPKWFVSSWMENLWGYLPDEIRPFPAVSYQITALWGAASPVGHHLLNILLHAANGALVFLVARSAAGMSAAGAAFAGLVFVLLPVHTESVAWITGRVDTMPTLFYLASFLEYVRWRAHGSSSRRTYALALAWFFVALFTKQNTITMVASLCLFDLLVGRSGVRLSWSWVRPYVPFVLLTVGYLLLRYLLFGEVVREGQLGTSGLRDLVHLVGRHLTHVVIGKMDAWPEAVWLALALAAVPAALMIVPADASRASRIRKLVFFGPVWWLIGVAPIAVAGYESPRHVYLAAVGWALVLGMAGDTLRRQPEGSLRWVPVALAIIVLGFYGFRLYGAVGEYNFLAAVSARAVRELTVEVRASKPGTLLIVGVPPPAWEWALPFAVQPPFTRTDLTQRVFIVSPRALHCCRSQWFRDTKRTLQSWAAGPSPDLAVAMAWDARTGTVSRTDATSNASLLIVSKALIQVDDPDALDWNIRRMVDQLQPR